MKKRTIIILFAIVSFVLLSIGAFNITLRVINRQMEELLETPIENIDFNDLTDGTYLGEVKTIPIQVIVEVVVVDKRITEIQIIKHRSGEGEPAEVIIDDILLNQSTNVDAIAGATYSSKAILIAINNALNNEPNN